MPVAGENWSPSGQQRRLLMFWPGELRTTMNPSSLLARAASLSRDTDRVRKGYPMQKDPVRGALDESDHLLHLELMIARRADELARNTRHRRDLDLWLEAEREILVQRPELPLLFSTQPRQ